jgi:deoxyguanosine kinase
LQKDEYRLFRRLFNIVFETLPKPDLYVYLHLSIENLLKNIRKRGREYEQKMDPAYLEQIQQGYFEYFKQVTQFPILIIDTNGIDFVGNNSDFERLKDTIFNNTFKSGVNRIIL